MVVEFMHKVRRALILGGGIGGLAAGTALAQRDVSVDLVEIRPEFAASGVGLGQPANGLRALRHIGCLDRCLDAGYQFDRLVFRDQAGEPIVDHRFAMGDGDGLPPMNALPRTALHHILLDAAREAGVGIRMGVTADAVSQNGTGAHVRFTDGASDRYDLVVGFDGIRSWTRQSVLGAEERPVHSGYAAWRSIVARPPEVTCMEFYQGIGSKTGVMPLTDDSMYIFHIGADDGSSRGDQDAARATLRERTRRYGGAVPQMIDAVSDRHEVVYSPIEIVLVPEPSWHRGSVVIVGDAAHASAPHLTQGASMALEDAVALVEELAKDAPLAERLARLVRRRYQRCAYVQRFSHRMLLAEQGISTADEMASAKRGMFQRLDRELTRVDRVMDQAY